MQVGSSPEPGAELKPVFHQNRYALALDELVRPGCSWLDIGAGTKLHDGWIGPSCEELASRAGYLAGCDVVEAVEAHPLLHEARVADAAHLPWPDSTFDLVSANMVVEHLAEPEAVFADVRRVLRPGGRFIFVTPNRAHPIIGTASVVLHPRIRRWYGIHVEGRSPEDVFETHYRCNTVAAVSRAAAAAELSPELIEPFVSSAPLLPGPAGRIEIKIANLAVHSRFGRAMGSNLLVVLVREDPAPPA